MYATQRQLAAPSYSDAINWVQKSGDYQSKMASPMLTAGVCLKIALPCAH